MKIEKKHIAKDRIEIARIIEINLPNLNIKRCKEIADCILLYLIERK